MNHEITYFLNGNKRSESYYNDLGQPHNESGPAIINYHESGNKYSEIYYVNGKSHNVNGPTYIWYYENGKIINKEYYLNDKRIYVKTDEEFQKYINRLNIS